MESLEREELNLEQPTTKTETVKCDGCGSNMTFNPETQKLYCEHCGSTKELQNVVDAMEKDLVEGFVEENDWEEDKTVVFSCDNCGAKVVMPKGSTASNCPFCGTSHVQESSELAGLKPNAVIPFAISEEQGKEKVKAWAKRKLYAPKKFKKDLQSENFKGVYTPCFTFDSRTTSYYDGVVGDRHTRVVGSGNNRRTETYIVWRRISGIYNDFFDDILVAAGSKINQQQINKLSPYSTNSSKGYQEEYLLGFMAYKHDQDIKSCWEKAKGTMDNALRKRILSQYHYDVLQYLNVSTTHEDVTFKYVMLPAYVGNFKFKKKLYNFYVNGETGKITGKTPVSAGKVLATVFSALAVVGGVVAILLLL